MIVKSIDTRYLRRAINAANKFYRINHANPTFDAALEFAGYYLNELGMNLFNASIIEYEKRESYVSLVSTEVDNQAVVKVQETYPNGVLF